MFDVFLEEDDSRSSSSDEDIFASPSAEREQLALNAVSNELQTYSEGPKSSPRCSRLRRYFMDRPVYDPAAAGEVLSALNGVLVEAIYGVALLKGINKIYI